MRVELSDLERMEFREVPIKGAFRRIHCPRDPDIIWLKLWHETAIPHGWAASNSIPADEEVLFVGMVEDE